MPPEPNEGAKDGAEDEARADEAASHEKVAPAPVVAPKLGRRPALLVAGVGLALFALLGPKLPRDQRLRVPLGDARPKVREARIAWATTDGEPLREASFSFPPGQAPEALIHELRLPDGDYDVDVEIVLMEGRTASRKRVTVSGATTTLDVSFRP